MFFFFLFFLISKHEIFSKVKNPKMSSRPNRVPPHPGRGTLWYHKPYGTIGYLMVPWGILWYHKVPSGTMRYLMIPSRGGARRCWDAFFFPLIFDLWKKNMFLIQKIKKSSKLIKYKGVLTFWRLEKNPHEISVSLVQKSLETDNSESSYDTFWF